MLQDVVDVLAERFPGDSGDLWDAFEVLSKNKVKTYDRLAKLTDQQWHRINVPIGALRAFFGLMERKYRKNLKKLSRHQPHKK